jgi:hypothetical protein
VSIIGVLRLSQCLQRLKSRSNPPPRHGPPSSIRPEINNLGSRPRVSPSLKKTAAGTDRLISILHPIVVPNLPGRNYVLGREKMRRLCRQRPNMSVSRNFNYHLVQHPRMDPLCRKIRVTTILGWKWISYLRYLRQPRSQNLPHLCLSQPNPSPSPSYHLWSRM